MNNWKTTDLTHEYIDLNKDDPSFKKNNLEGISGYYTLLVEGFTNSSYSLFVSTHPQKVLPLRNNRPVVCSCKLKGDKCFLRYNEVFDKENNGKISSRELRYVMMSSGEDLNENDIFQKTCKNKKSLIFIYILNYIYYTFQLS